MDKNYKNVSDLIKNLSEDENFKKDALNKIEKHKLAKFLFFLRCEHRLTQKELADKIQCTQGKVSKIESSNDDELSIKDFLDYGKALGLQLEIGFREKNVTYADMVKHHAFAIQHYLQLLAGLAKEDEQITKGVSDFHLEALINMNKIILDSALSLQKLGLNKGSKAPSGSVHIAGTIEQQESVEKNVCEEIK